ECRDGKAERIAIENVPSFADRLDAALEVEGLGALKVDIAYGGDSFVIVDAAALGFSIAPDEARDLAETGVRIIAAANDQIGFSHPERSGWDHISFCLFAGPLTREGNELRSAHACVVRPGKIDRSPTGTGCSARMAALSARGLMNEATSTAPARSSARNSSAASPAWPGLAGGRRSSRLFPGGAGLPGLTSICWIRPIRGRRATGSRTPGRGLEGRFERFSAKKALS